MKGLLFISHQTEKYSYLQSVQIALEGGCKQIQLRMKEADLEEIQKTGTESLKLCNQYEAQLYIDDHVSVCEEIGAKGVHLGKLDMSPSAARTILGNRFIIGGTANTFEDIRKLDEEGVDYIGLGPFRFTSTKKNLSPIIGLEGYRRIINNCRERHIHLPILAIGGITINDIPEIMQTGVSGIALSSTILNAADPVAETQRIVNLINTYQQ
ncbi:thiamine phosphate synthase [Bacteroides sp. 224]|uniref:thiamine phosphate synthase n=1 Tax=Bacteroides sp. 224 TaxID=2302936 RepID=UPI0013D00E69|nr:thiamine phosphate synthase [Bacteroides sp. 224]NDV64442.1 thiamine phosphate synthase [Bacteroides sp. 224]